jgi:hypothetical protein
MKNRHNLKEYFGLSRIPCNWTNDDACPWQCKGGRERVQVRVNLNERHEGDEELGLGCSTLLVGYAYAAVG